MLRTLKKLLVMVVSVFVACALLVLLVQAFAPQDNGFFPILITAIVCVLLGGVSTLFLAGHALRELCGGETRGSSAQVLRQILGVDESIQIIENGRTAVPSNGKLSLPGPRLVIIRESVVTFYQGSKRTRIEGPGFVHTKLWEYAQNAQDLRPRQRNFEFSDIVTKDDFPMQCDLRVSYGIDVASEVLQGTRKLTPPDTGPLQKMDLYRPDMESAVRSVLETELRRQVRNTDEKALKGPNMLARIDDHLVAQANRRLSLVGIKIHSVVIAKLCPCQDLVRAYAWAEATKSMDVKTATALNELSKGSTIQPNDILIETLRRVLIGLVGDRKNSAWSALVGRPPQQVEAGPSKPLQSP